MENIKKGKLKIFFGYCAGVGKTFAMLEAAHQKYVQGVDVIIGYVEPHDRRDTINMSQGLEQIPVKKMVYRDRLFYEFDLDAALKRKPQLILVDELAHTNIQGSRHKKRYSDIEELLRAGIDVYTTVNVQHIESLHDVIESITRIKVNERIPDHIFDKADDVQLVDIEIDELIERLNEGKIYHESQAKKALQNFFIKDNLIALREIALRRCADRMNLIAPKENRPFVKEHILVCIGASPTNEKVIRTAARMAQAFHGDFTALYVETSQNENLSDKALMQLQSNLTLARHLGADIVSTYGNEVAYQISQYAKTSNVSKLVLGRSYQKPAFFKKSTIVDQLTSLAPNLEIYIIPDTRTTNQKQPLDMSGFAKLSMKETLITTTILLITTVLAFFFDFLQLNITNIILLYILSSCLIAMTTFYPVYNFIATIFSILAINFLFIPPRYTFSMHAPEYPIIFVVMFVVSISISMLAHRFKRENFLSSIHAHSMDILLETSQRLQSANNYDDIREETCYQLYRLLSRCIIFYPVKNNQLQEPILYGEHITSSLEANYLNHEERAVAQWVLINNKNAGVSTSTLPAANALYLSIRKKDVVFAVVGISMHQGEDLPPYEKALLKAILNEIALTIDSTLKQSQHDDLILKQQLKESMAHED